MLAVAPQTRVRGPACQAGTTQLSGVATDGSNYGAQQIFLEGRQCFDCWSGGMQSLRN